LFPIARIEGKDHSIQFVGSANIEDVIMGSSGELLQADLNHEQPYFMVCIVTQNCDESASFSEFVRKQFDMANARKVDNYEPGKPFHEIVSLQLINMIAAYTRSNSSNHSFTASSMN
jgi:hypothetical protein